MKAQKIIIKTEISDYSELTEIQSQQTRDELKINQSDSRGLNQGKMNLDVLLLDGNEEAKTDSSDIDAANSAKKTKFVGQLPSSDSDANNNPKGLQN